MTNYLTPDPLPFTLYPLPFTLNPIFKVNYEEITNIIHHPDTVAYPRM